MKGFVKEIKDRISNGILKRNEEQELREEKLKQLEENQNKKGFKLLHPVQANENRKEIKKLKQEINEHKEKRKNQRLILICLGVFAFLFIFIGVMSVIDGDNESANDYSYVEGNSDEDVVTEKSTEVLTEVTTKDEVTTEIETITETTVHIHQNQDATCFLPETCLICEETFGEPLQHSYVNGICVSCGNKEPGYISEEMVWIPTNGGTKYHTHSSCSKMNNPIYVTKSEAINRGFDPCGRCY